MEQSTVVVKEVTKKIVRFDENEPEVHHIETWYYDDNLGLTNWLQDATDRDRFQRRIAKSDEILKEALLRHVELVKKQE